jgi:hypothetical protein
VEVSVILGKSFAQGSATLAIVYIASLLVVWAIVTIGKRIHGTFKIYIAGIENARVERSFRYAVVNKCSYPLLYFLSKCHCGFVKVL